MVQRDSFYKLVTSWVSYQVVKKAIGYSPEEVTAALSSKTKAAEDMMNTLKKFQFFLVNFEAGFIWLKYMNNTFDESFFQNCLNDACVTFPADFPIYLSNRMGVIEI